MIHALTHDYKWKSVSHGAARLGASHTLVIWLMIFYIIYVNNLSVSYLDVLFIFYLKLIYLIPLCKTEPGRGHREN